MDVFRNKHTGESHAAIIHHFAALSVSLAVHVSAAFPLAVAGSICRRHPILPAGQELLLSLEEISITGIMINTKGLEGGADRILIFEDDILLQGFDGQKLQRATTFLSTLPAWNAFFLGALTTRIDPTAEPAVARIRYRCLAHAYALNRPFAQRIIQEGWSGIPFDNLLRHHGNDFFALAPMVAFQGQASTDNQTMLIDRMRRFFGGLPLIQNMNEYFQRHKAVFVWLHLLLGLALLFWIIMGQS